MRFFKQWQLLFAALAIAVLALSFACGGDDDDSGDDDDAETPAATETEEGDDDGGDGGEQAFDVSMGDNFFDPEGFTAAPGSELTFNISNDGTAIHNMRVAGADGEYNTDDDAVSDSDLVNGGDTAVLEWTTPDESGEYAFQCDLHPTDMLGTITVE